MAHEANKMKRNLMQISALTKTVGEYLRGCSVYFGIFPLYRRDPFAFQLVEPKILAKTKTPHDPHHCIGSNV